MGSSPDSRLWGGRAFANHGQEPPGYGRRRVTGHLDDGKRYWAWALGILLLASLWHGPALHAGYLLDDYAQEAMLNGEYPVPRANWDLYNFSSGDPAETRALMATGFYPWWSHPEVRLSMFRPLASWLRALDHHLFGAAPLAAHLHGLVYWWALLLAIAGLFRHLLPARTALLALLIFGLDQAHPISLAWLANRGSILSALFGTLSLASYLRWRGAVPTGVRARRRARWLTSAWFLLALSAGEYALCLLGFFLAYEWLGHSDPPTHRLRALARALLVPTLLFLLGRYLTGGGARHSGIYVDPLHDPRAFVTALWQRYPVLVADGLLSLRAEYWSFGAPWTAALVDAGYLPSTAVVDYGPWRRVHHALGLGAVLLGLWSVVRVARLGRITRGAMPTSGAGHAVWLGVGGLLAALPVAAALPGSRLLLIPAVGLAPLLASLLRGWVWRGRQGRPRRPAIAWGLSCISRLPALAFGAALLLLHLGLDPLQARAEAVMLSELPERVRQAVLRAPMDADWGAAVLVGSDDPTLLIYMGMIRRAAGRPTPARIWALSGNRFGFQLARSGPRSLTLRYSGGRAMLTEPFEQMFRAPSEPLRAGAQVQLPGLTVEVRETRSPARHGAPTPTNVTFKFTSSLEKADVHLLLPTRQGIRPLAAPAKGRPLDLPSPATPLPAP